MRLGIKDLQPQIVGPGIPNVGQERFQAELRRRCGYSLAWHRRRKVFMAYRRTGSGRPVFAHTEMGNRQFPLTVGLAALVADAARLADALTERDALKAMDVYQRRQADLWDEDRNAYIAERMPDFAADFERVSRMIVHGRRDRKRSIVDLGAR